MNGKITENPQEQKQGILFDLKPQKQNYTNGGTVGSLLKRIFKRYFIDAFTGMAQGLFCTLIAGTILAMFGGWIQGAGTSAGVSVGNLVVSVANIAKVLMGAGIGVGIAHSLKTSKLVMFTAAVAGLAGAFADKIIAGELSIAITLTAGGPGNPIGSYVAAVIAIEIGNLVSGKTKLDIVLVPLSMMIVTIFALYAAWPIIRVVFWIGKGIELATAVTPEAMGIIIAVCMGVLLTLPTSSAAIWLAIALGVTSDSMLLAGGAAAVGCACHMVGFAVQSFRENGVGGLIAQGLGTSMLQIPNLMRHPQIIIPPIVASVICGPLSTCVFGLRCTATGGGMGTSGLVGVFGVIDASSGVIADWQIGLGIALLFFVIPAVVCFGLSEIMRRFKFIKYGDMALE